MTTDDPQHEAALLATWADESATRAIRETAFAEFVAIYQRRIYAICLRQLNSHADAEEATQDTFAKLARAAASFRGDAKVSTFAYRVAVNACRDLQRRQGRRPSIPVADIEVAAQARGDGSGEVADLAISVELSDELTRAMAGLDDLSRTLVILCSIQGHSYPEVSEILDLPVGTIKSRIFRARAALAEALAETGVLDAS